MDDRDRTDAAYGLLERDPALRDVDPPCLQPEQCGHRLQVVLHAVVDLADHRVLGDQLAITAAQLGDVAQQHQTAGVLARRTQRDRPKDQRGHRVAELGVPWPPATQHGADGLLVRSHRRRHQLARRLRQRLPAEVTGQPELAVDRLRVGTGIGDQPRRVDADEPVTDARAVRVVRTLPREREGAARDHLRELAGRLQVGQLQPARRTHALEVGVARHHGDQPVSAPHRDGLDPHRHVVAPFRITLACDAAVAQRGVEERSLPRLQEGADDVVDERCRTGRRPHLPTGPVAGPALVRQPQHEIGEAEVGDDLPVGQQHREPSHVGGGEVGVGPGERQEGRHPIRLGDGASYDGGRDCQRWAGSG